MALNSTRFIRVVQCIDERNLINILGVVYEFYALILRLELLDWNTNIKVFVESSRIQVTSSDPSTASHGNLTRCDSGAAAGAYLF